MLPMREIRSEEQPGRPYDFSLNVNALGGYTTYVIDDAEFLLIRMGTLRFW